MTTVKKLWMHTLVVTALSTALTVQADQFEDSGFYLGGAYGMVKVQDSNFEDENDFGELFAGLQILSFLGIEAAYYDFGRYGNDFASSETTATSLTLAGRLPLSSVIAIYADVGPMWWDTDVQVGSFSADYDGEDVKFGTGISFELSENLDIRAEYEWVDVDIEGSDISSTSPEDFDSDLNTVSIGLKFQF